MNNKMINKSHKIYYYKFYGSCLSSCCSLFESIIYCTQQCGCCFVKEVSKELEDVNNLCCDGSYNHNFYEDVNFSQCEPSCKRRGVKYKYWVCLKCNKKFVEDAKGLNFTTDGKQKLLNFIKDDELFIPKNHHQLKYYPEFIPNCDSKRKGNKAFYECEKCFTKYKTEECNVYYTEFGVDSYSIEIPKHDYEKKQVNANSIMYTCKGCSHVYFEDS